MPVIAALRRLRQKDHEFEISLDYTVSSRLALAETLSGENQKVKINKCHKKAKVAEQ
jgi:hypothetical protein